MSDDERPGASADSVASAPVYRHPHPTLTDEEGDDLRVWIAECMRQCSTATDGGNEELAERWRGRAHRAMSLLVRMGGGE